MGAFEDSLAAAASLEPTDAEEPADNVDKPGGAPGDSDSGAGDADSEADSDSADDAEDGDGAADVPSAGNASEAGELLIAGDVASACKLMGIDPKLLQINVPKFEAMRKGLKESKALEASATAKLAEATTKAEKADAIVEDAKKTYGPLIDLKFALKARDFYAAKELLEQLAPEGVTYQQIAEGIAAAAKGTSPSEVAYRRKLREIAEKERKQADEAKAAKEAEQTTAQEAARVEANKKGAAKHLKGTPFEGLPGAEEALIKLASDNWDPVKKGLKLKPEQLVKLLAKDPVIGQLAELKRLKSGKPAAAPAPVVTTRTERPVKRTEAQTKAEKHEAERKAAIAEAARLEQQSARAARRR